MKDAVSPVKKSEDPKYSYLWIFWGIIFALIELVYTFFPFFYVLDVILFLLVGSYVQRKYIVRKRERILYGVLPSMILILFFLYRLGKENLLGDEGAGWLISFFLIPFSAILGSYLQRRYRESYL